MTEFASSLQDFRNQFAGTVLIPGDSAYDEHRAIWNGMFDKKPALIARCTSREDVALSVKYARKNDLLISVKGGGHNSAGNAVCDDGLMIDLSAMQDVKVNPQNRTALVEGGCLLGRVDEATQEHGLAVSAGIVSHTGAGGLTLGGGFGWISRKYGLTIDNLLSVELVTAEGEIVKASADENEDLFWGTRGGGGNFGIVTTFEFQAAHIGTELYTGPVVKHFEDAGAYIHFHQQYVRTLPDEMTVWMVLRHAPPLPFIPEEYHGKLVILLPFVWSHGARNYWKSHHLKDLDEKSIEVITRFAAQMPSEECEVFIPHMEGAPSRIGPTATAFPHRYTPFVLNLHTRWQEKSDDDRCIAWARDFHDATRPFSKGVYVNFLSEEGDARVREAYTEEVWARLVEVKRKWDPENVFRMNQNIAP